MDNIFVRNMVIFTCIITISAGLLLYGLFKGDSDIETADQWVSNTHKVIIEAEQLTTYIESMLSAQRGYIITGNQEFLEEYESNKSNVSQSIANLAILTSDSPSQTSRLDEIRNYFNTFSQSLETRAATLNLVEKRTILSDVANIDQLRDNIFRINSNILQEEYELLIQRVNALENYRMSYRIQLAIGIVFGTILILIFNGFLFHAQRKRSKAETSLKSSEERFVLAVDGTQDGVFDWDIKSGQVFYSQPFFRMLGYTDRSSMGTIKDFEQFLHPEEKAEVLQHIEDYFEDRLSEYEQDFRMKHQSGRWIWVKSRAKAIRDKNGKAIRMVGANTDITVLKKEQTKLELEKNIAEEQNQAKSEFLAHMSHEIRTPLTAITGVGEILLKQKDQFNEKQTKLIKTLNSSANILKELINDILDFSKIEDGEIELDEQAFRLDAVFEETISMMSLKANEKGVSFVFDYNAIKDEQFYGDASRFRQILVNLVGNAIKFTDDGGVTVECIFEDRDGQNFLRVNVSDTGIGIEPENFDLVFERFKQADSSVSRKYGGTGLGLPISKQLAKLMGGDIFLSSEAGKGSTFSLLLPLKITSGSSSEIDKSSQSEKINQQLLASLNNETKILIVEDYEGNIVVLSHIIEDLSFDYNVARNGIEAVSMWEDNHYDLILMDVQMPEMDGFAATSKIREQESEKEIARTPIIGMTAHALVGDKDKCIAAGMDSYLPKPLVEADLKREMLKYIEENKKAA